MIYEPRHPVNTIKLVARQYGYVELAGRQLRLLDQRSANGGRLRAADERWLSLIVDALAWLRGKLELDEPPPCSFGDGALCDKPATHMTVTQDPCCVDPERRPMCFGHAVYAEMVYPNTTHEEIER
jgi:hypothetical protein